MNPYPMLYQDQSFNVLSALPTQILTTPPMALVVSDFLAADITRY